MKVKITIHLFVFFISLLLLVKDSNSQGFSFEITPKQKTFYIGDAVTFGINITPYGGFSASISFNLELPNCLNNYILISPAIVNWPYNNVNMFISNTNNLTPGLYPIVIKGSNGIINLFDTCYATILNDTNNLNWNVYQTINSGMQSNAVVGIDVDRYGKAWIASRHTYGTQILGNLTMYDGVFWNVYTYNQLKVFDHCGNLMYSSNGNYFSTANLTCIAIDSLDNKWIGTNSNGVIKIDSAGNWVKYTKNNSLLPDNEIRSIEVDSYNQIWIASNGLVRINNFVWSVYTTANTILPSDIIHQIAFDNSGNTWFGCGHSNLVKFDGTYFTIYNSFNSPLPASLFIDALAVDHFNQVWIGGRCDGVIRFDGVNAHQYTSFNSNLANNCISALAIWSGTVFALCSPSSYNTSLSYWNGNDWVNYDSTNSNFPHWISAIPAGVEGDLFVNPKDNSLWVGLEHSGIIHIIDTSRMNLVISSVNEMIQEKKVNVYPVPFTNDFTIECANLNAAFIEIKIYDLYGQLVYEQEKSELQNGHKKISGIHTLTSGVYLLSIKIDAERRVIKIIKN